MAGESVERCLPQGQPTRFNDMKKNLLLIFVLITALSIACSTGKRSTGVWMNHEKLAGKSFKKIFILVLTANIEARTQVENDLAAAAALKGYEAVKSIDLLPPSFYDTAMPAKDEIVRKVKASGCDAVFVASLLRKEEAVKHTPGRTSYAAQPYYTWGGGNYYGYYSYMRPTVYTPDYYTTEKNYFMQSNLYDAASEEIIWSVQSGIFNPSSLKKFSQAYMTSLINQLDEEKMLKK